MSKKPENYQIKLKEAKAGMLIKQGNGPNGAVEGLIIEIDAEGKDTSFFEGPWICTLCFRDAYHGPGLQNIDPESTVEVIVGADRRNMLNRMVGEVYGSIQDRTRDLENLMECLKR